MTAVISEFISRYEKEYDFYHNLSMTVERRLKDELSRAGVRAIVSSRAKSIHRLDVKLKNRSADKKYERVEQIYDDIIDLAGVRVALYFPGDMGKVKELINTVFKVIKSKNFPEGEGKKVINNYRKVFDGYSASHFRVSLKDESSRYGNNHCVEIQVASVLMHAWSEVEHDLVYKPLQGELSEEELMILDEINGLVLSGNIALERLQRAGLSRVNNNTTKTFMNHFDLASFVTSAIRIDEKNFDFVAVFSILKSLSLNTPAVVRPILDSISESLSSLSPQKTVKGKTKSFDVQDFFIKLLGTNNHNTVISKINVLVDTFSPKIPDDVTEYFKNSGSEHKMVINLICSAISKYDTSGSAAKVLPVVHSVGFDYTFEKDEFNNLYTGIISIDPAGSKELDDAFDFIDGFSLMLLRLLLTKTDIDKFIQACKTVTKTSSS